MNTFNPKHIVSIRFIEEKIDNDYKIINYRSLLEWVLGKPKRKIIRFRALFDSSILIELNNLSSIHFIRDDKVWEKANLYFRFSNNTVHRKYFESNKEALLFKANIESNNFINL
jgi:hypothetical protein